MGSYDFDKVKLLTRVKAAVDNPFESRRLPMLASVIDELINELETVYSEINTLKYDVMQLEGRQLEQ